MTADPRTSRLMLLLGHLDYGDHHDEVDGLDRLREATAILEWVAKEWALVEYADLEHLISAHGTLCGTPRADGWDAKCSAMWDRLGDLQPRTALTVTVSAKDLDEVLDRISVEDSDLVAVKRLSDAVRSALGDGE